MATLTDIANKLNNSKVTKINDIGVGVDSMGSNWIRYDNGVQVVWGTIESVNLKARQAYPVPFVGSYSATATVDSHYDSTINCTVWREATAINVNTEATNYWAHYICCGKWK